jgi:hypothetical protein
VACRDILWFLKVINSWDVHHVQGNLVVLKM